MKTLITLCLGLCFGLTGMAQDFDNFKPTLSSGLVPKDFTTASAKKYRKEIQKISKDAKRKERKADEQFYLESNFLVDDMLHSGRVLFNDPFSEYIREIAAILLKDEPRLLEKLRFYTLRSPAVNAFATDQGMIFITVGLLAQLENEAQLAFVLSHEIAHVTEKHGLELFREVNSLPKKDNDPSSLLKQTGFTDKLLAQSYYSKEKEMEADSKGFDRFLKTDYDLEAALNFFEVLRYGYLPFDELRFEKAIFENGGFIFPDDYVLEEVKRIEGIAEDRDDSRSTHPNITTRKRAIKKQLEGEMNKKKTYLVSEETFLNLRKRARFELPVYFLNSEQFYSAIYSAYLSLQEDPDNPYLKKCIAQALYVTTKYRNDDRSFIGDIDEVEGEIQSLFHFFDKISDEELTILTARYIWNLHLETPNDDYLAFAARDILVELAYHHNLELNNFASKHPEVSPETAEQTEYKLEEEEKREEPGYTFISGEDSTTVEVQKKSKYEKIKAKQEDFYFEEYAFVELLAMDTFVQAFEKALEVKEDRKEYMEYYETSKGRQEYREEQKKKERKGQRLGIKKVLVLNPFYLRVDLRKTPDEVKYVLSEQNQAILRERMEENAKKVGLRIEFLDVADLNSKDVEAFNDIIILREWVNNQLDFESLSITPGYRQNEVKAIAEKYGIDHIIIGGVFSARERSAATYLEWAVGLMFYPILPYVVYEALSPQFESLLFLGMYNVNSGYRETLKLKSFAKKDREGIINAHLYDTFLQLSSKPKKK